MAYLITEDNKDDISKLLSTNNLCFFFKMVGVGPESLRQVDKNADSLITLISEQRGFFLFVESPAQLRELMHQYIDRFCDAQEKFYEPK